MNAIVHSLSNLLDARRVAFWLFALRVLFGVLAIALRPSINNDSAMGFDVLQSMRAGAPFNVAVHPDMHDISKDEPAFIAAWTPAQYLLPALAQWMFDVDLGQGIAVAVAVCLIAGIFGWYRLYLALGFDERLALTCCVLIELFRNFTYPFYEYDGGEVCLFAAAPWSTLLLYRAFERGGSIRLAVATATALALATFAKLSGFVFVSSLICGLAIFRLVLEVRAPASLNESIRAVRSVVGQLVPVAAVWLAFLAMLYLFWLSRGWTALNDRNIGFALASERIYIPLVSTFLAISGLGDALSYFLPRPFYDNFGNLIFALLLPFCIAYLLYTVRSMGESRRAIVVLILVTCLAYAVCLMAILVSGALYSGDRYFRSTNLLLLPCLVFAYQCLRVRWLKGLLATAVVLLAVYGTASSARHLVTITARPVGDLGFRHPSASRELLDYLHAEFSNPAAGHDGTVVYVTSPEIGLEVRRARVIPTFADYDLVDWLKARKYSGTVADLVVVLPVRFLNDGKANAILQSFADYAPDRWQRQDIGSSYVAFRQRR